MDALISQADGGDQASARICNQLTSAQLLGPRARAHSSREGQPYGPVGHIDHGIPGPKCVLGFIEQETIYRPVTTPVGKEVLYVLFQSLGRQV